MPKFCPECNTQAYDDTSFFCHNCGTRLPAFMTGRRRDVSRISSRVVPRKESLGDRAGTLPSVKSMSSLTIEPIEICASCGVPIDDKTRIFCGDCGAYIREGQTGEKSPYSIRNVIPPHPGGIKQPVREPKIGISRGSQNPVITSVPGHESAPVNTIPVQGMNITRPKAKEWTLIPPIPDGMNHPVPEPGPGISRVSQNPGITSIPGHGPAPVNAIPVQGTNNTPPKGKEWRLIFIFGGIALLYLLLMLVLILTF